MTTQSGRWAAATASVRGASHERNGKPNQDAVRVVEVSGSNPGLVAAVCDGHGGERYVRSDVGSRLGVEVACDVGSESLVDLGVDPGGAAIDAQLAGPVAERIVDRWRKRVLDDVGRHPFTDVERASVGGTIDADPFISYGCTLVMAVVAPTWVGLLQIGDGDITVVLDGRATAPVPGDDRLVGGETTSLCLPTAVTDARVAALTGTRPDLVILTSDGYANSFASPTWHSDAGLDLLAQVRTIGLEGVEERLPSWLADSATAGGDDVSMALIVDRAERIDPPVTAARPGVVPIDTSGPTTMQNAGARAPSAAKRRGVGAMAATALAAVALLIGGAAGWFVGSASDTTSESASTSSTTTTTSTTTTAAPDPTTDTSGATALNPADQAIYFVGANPDDASDPTGSDGSIIVVDTAALLDPTLELDPRRVAWVQSRGARSPEERGAWRLQGRDLIAPMRTTTRFPEVLSFSLVGDQIFVLTTDDTIVRYDANTGRPLAEPAPVSDHTTPAAPATSPTGATGSSTTSSSTTTPKPDDDQGEG